MVYAAVKGKFHYVNFGKVLRNNRINLNRINYFRKNQEVEK